MDCTVLTARKLVNAYTQPKHVISDRMLNYREIELKNKIAYYYENRITYGMYYKPFSSPNYQTLIKKITGARKRNKSEFGMVNYRQLRSNC